MALSNLSGWNNNTGVSSACGTGCGSADKPAEAPAACGSADQPSEVPAACGSACGASEK